MGSHESDTERMQSEDGDAARSVRTIVERIALHLYFVVALGVATAGFSIAGLGVTLRASSFDMEAMPLVAAGAIALGATLGIGGSIAVVLSRARVDSLRRKTLGGGRLLLFLTTLVVLPFLLWIDLDPLLQFWREVWAKAEEWGLWEQGAGMGAWILVPIAAVLSIPFFVLLAAFTAALSCALLLALRLVRSAHLLRVLVLGVILTGTLLVAGYVGAAATERLSPSVEKLIRDTADPEGVEQERALAALRRYKSVTRESAATILWAWVGLAVWLPILAKAERQEAISEE